MMASETTAHDMKDQEAVRDGSNGQDARTSMPMAQNPYFTSCEAGKKSWTSSFGPFLAHLERPKDLKILLRCSLCVWIASLFIVINPTLTACE